MDNKQKALLVLNTSDLPTQATQVGVKDATNTSFTWFNLNLRQILGDMWDKYTIFNLNLVEICSAETDVSITGDLQTVILQIKGLPWINCNYDSKLKCITNTSTLSSYTFVTGYTDSKSYTNNSISFSKQQEQADITIFYRNVNTGQVSSISATNYPNITLIFNITGIIIDKDDFSQRMLINK